VSTTSIQWTDRVWNPVTGCTKVSAGCKHCYAETIAGRFWATQYDPVPTGRHDAAGNGPETRPRAFTDVLTHEDRLTDPLSWRKPARVFVNSMSDLFHHDVPDEFIDRVFAVMAFAAHHTYQILTKRADRMRDYFGAPWHQRVSAAYRAMRALGIVQIAKDYDRQRQQGYAFGSLTCGQHRDRFLPNVWLGVSVEDQQRADERIPLLLRTPAAVRFISAEPLLGHIDLAGFIPKRQPWKPYVECRHGYDACPICDASPSPAVDWVIVGGESGAGARTCHTDWIRAIVNQCASAGVAVFVKQLGSKRVDYSGVMQGDVPSWKWPGFKDRQGGDPSEWPADLRVRQFPSAAQEALER
jgi:protein gp37